ncbi:MAG: redox-regulated ATPase YchF [Patescibacteria group bacterium]
MSFSVGIVGLPNVGKSTLFKALTKKQVNIANYPFCTIDPNVGVVAVPDDRLEKLAKIENSAKIVPTTIEFYDIAGLVKGAHEGEGLGNKFLSHIREVDAILEVVREFNDKNIIHVYSEINPKNDMEIVNLELIFADLSTLNKRIEDLEGQTKSSHEKKILHSLDIFERTQKKLEEGRLANEMIFTDEEKDLLKPLNLLTIKPILYVLNVDEDKIKEKKDPRENFLKISAKIEAELSELPSEEAKIYLQELGLEESGLDKIIKACYQKLNLITFITAGPIESKAWTCEKGARAPQAAGKIHTDFEKGFICAEIINWQDLLKNGSYSVAKEKGLIRIEGKEYIMQDGDVAHFRFNL